MTTTPSNVNAYLRTKVMTASPEELRLMLLDGAIKFARQAAEGLASRHPEQTFTGFERCRAIVLELINSVRPDVDPDLCQRVSSLYTFIFGELVNANLEKDSAKLAKVIELLEFERQTWALLMDRLAEERVAANAARAVLGGDSGEEPEAPARTSAPSERISLSIQG
jgi:flagellar secretion chaperone FliS